MKNPNVIYILADDMGYGDFSTFNANLNSNEAIDTLVHDGVILTNCHASSPVCAPARASIMTGRYPQRGGVIDTLESRGFDRLKLSETTIAEVFKQNGYATVLIGKWHLGALDPKYHPLNRGFEYFFGFRGGWNYYYDYTIEKNWERIQGDGTYITDVFSQEAVNYIKEHADRPFFMHLAYNAPHFPLEAPQKLIDKYKAEGNYTDAVCRIYAMIECMDKGIGMILNELENQGIADNTIVIFTSDNGPDFSGTGDDCRVRFNCNLKGEKMQVYEGGIKVPAVVRWSAALPRGKVTDEFIHGTDWLPTLMKLCGLEYSKQITFDGMDVSAALQGKKLPDRTMCWQWNRYSPVIECNAAIRDSQYKLVHAPVFSHLNLPDWEVAIDVDIKKHPDNYKAISNRPIPSLPVLNPPIPELYLIESDQEEKNNIAQNHPVKVAQMEHKLNAWFEEVEREKLET